MAESSGTFGNIVVAVRGLLDVCYPKKSSEEAQHRDLDTLKLVRPVFDPGDIVHIAPRLWPGINKPGGTAWILSVDDDHEFYDVKYVLTGATDRNVPCAYVRVANDVPEERGRRNRQSKPSASGGASGGRSARLVAVETSSRKSRLQVGTSSASSSSSSSASGSKKDRGDPVDGIEGDRGTKRRRVQEEEEEEDTSSALQPYSPPGPIVLLASTLDDDETKLLVDFCQASLPPLNSRSGVAAEIVHKYSHAVTHVIVSADKIKRRVPTDKRRGRGQSGKSKEKDVELVIRHRTMKYLQGLLSECMVDRSDE
jgi:hypothetical protein